MALPHEEYCQQRIAECERKNKPEFAKAWAAHLEKYVEQRNEREDKPHETLRPSRAV